MLVEGLLLIVGYYIFIGLGTYGYAIVKNFELTGMWNFHIENCVIAGIFKAPRWSVFWIEWIGGIVNGSRKEKR